MTPPKADMVFKVCLGCRQKKLNTAFWRSDSYADGRYSTCKVCLLARVKERHEGDPSVRRANWRRWYAKGGEALKRSVMLTDARKRAKQLNLPFDLTAQDIVFPTHCPVLGIPLNLAMKRGYRTPDSPSLDRLIPALGYVRSNVRIISWRANRLKSDGTTTEHEKIARYMREAGV